MKFVVKLYRKQLEAGRVFVHEHPATAKSWGLDKVQELTQEHGVDAVEEFGGVEGAVAAFEEVQAELSIVWGQR